MHQARAMALLSAFFRHPAPGRAVCAPTARLLRLLRVACCRDRLLPASWASVADQSIWAVTAVARGGLALIVLGCPSGWDAGHTDPPAGSHVRMRPRDCRSAHALRMAAPKRMPPPQVTGQHSQGQQPPGPAHRPVPSRRRRHSAGGHSRRRVRGSWAASPHPGAHAAAAGRSADSAPPPAPAPRPHRALTAVTSRPPRGRGA